MIDTLQSKMFDIIAADSRLIYTDVSRYPNFGGVRRCKNSPIFAGAGTAADDPAFGFVNLFDWPFEPLDNIAKPAVFMGMKGFEIIDQPDPQMPSVNGNMMNFRVARIPIVIVVDLDDRVKAKYWRNQLRINIQEILLDSNNIQNQWWRLITMDTPIQSRGINTGGGSAQVSHSNVDFIVELHYAQIRGSLVA